MIQNPPAGCQRVIPYLLYADAAAAIEFLCRAFGFTERFRMPGADGKVGHAEIGYQDNIVMLATAVKEMGHATPSEQPGRSFCVLCYVDDVDAHYAHAKAAGATIPSPPADQPYGDRTYRARDTEGNEWFFHTHVRDVAPEEFGK
jgi:PhnB protein